MKTNYGLVDRDFCIQKIGELRALVNKLLDSDFPHTDSSTALQRIAAVFEIDLAKLEAVDEADDPAVILEYCRHANINIARLHPFLGMLIRSSNLRNAFEIYFPLKVLSTEILESSDACVVLSSEWYFSPYTYPTALKELPSFIFIGVPASECQNPLIMPLSGHELGHVVWQRRGIKTHFDPTVISAVVAAYRENWGRFSALFNITTDQSRLETDMFLRRIWAQSYKLAARQLEEIFCDFLGIYIFGRSFLYSFRYLLAPSLGQFRAVHYPALHNRARYIEHAATAYSIRNLEGFDRRSFSEKVPELSLNDEFIVEMADAVTEELFPQLLPLVDKFHGTAEQFSVGESDEKRMRESLLKLVPPMPVTSVAALINAAWDVRLSLSNLDILKNTSDEKIRTQEKLRVLRDLTLKGLEVYEYRKRLEHYATQR